MVRQNRWDSGANRALEVFVRGPHHPPRVVCLVLGSTLRMPGKHSGGGLERWGNATESGWKCRLFEP